MPEDEKTLSHLGHEIAYNTCYLGTGLVLTNAICDILVHKDWSSAGDAVEAAGVLYLVAEGIRHKHNENKKADRHFKLLSKKHPTMDVKATIENAYNSVEGKHWYDRFSKKRIASEHLKMFNHDDVASKIVKY